MIALSQKKQIPKFKNEEEERTFWDAHDSTEYVDWTKGKRVTLSNQKPSTNADECQSWVDQADRREDTDRYWTDVKGGNTALIG